MKKSSNASIIFFGTSDFAVPILELLIKNNWPVRLVITQPDQPVGRHQKLQPPPIKTAAEKLGLKTLQPNSLKNFNAFNEFVDLFIVCAFGKFLPADILKIPKYGAINIHPSLLPKYRGPSPIQTALLNGDTKTGVSLMLLDEEMDHGPILAQKIVPIGENEAFPELSERLAQAGAELLLKTLPDYLSGKIKPRPQDHAQAAFSKILTREDGWVDCSRPAQEIYNQWRALQPWPGAFMNFRFKNSDLKIKLIKINPPVKDNGQNFISLLSEGTEGGLSGQFIKIKTPLEKARDLGIICGDGKVLPITLLQPEGKKIMTREEFINGYLK